MQINERKEGKGRRSFFFPFGKSRFGKGADSPFLTSPGHPQGGPPAKSAGLFRLVGHQGSTAEGGDRIGIDGRGRMDFEHSGPR